MLTKPISLYPDATIVHLDDISTSHLTLSATYPSSCSFETFEVDGVEYCYASLIMGDDAHNYRVYVGDEYGVETECLYPVLVRGTDTIKVEFHLDLSRTDLYGRDCDVSKGNMCCKTFLLSELMKSKIYRWKIRVFEKNSINNSGAYVPKTEIGYGTIEESTTSTYDGTHTVLTIFPHTNIYDYVLGEHPTVSIGTPSYLPSSQVVNTDMMYGICQKRFESDTIIWDIRNGVTLNVPSDSYYVSDSVTNVVEKVDPNIRYYIKTNGKVYAINKYRFLNFVESTGSNIQIQNGYLGAGFVDAIETIRDNNKLVPYSPDTLYQVFKYTDFKNQIDSYGNPIRGYALLETKDNFANNSTYTIACNYIDSDEAYFEIYTPSTVAFKDQNAEVDFTDESGNILYNNKENAYVLTHCNIDILGTISQSEGIEHDYYSYKIYEESQEGEFINIYSSGNIYNSNIRLTYNDFLDKRYYKVVIFIVDTNQYTIEKEIYFNTSFPTTVSSFMARAEYFKDHNSVIVEWDTLNSITPKISNQNYEFVSLTGAEEKDAVFLGENNSVVYYQNDYSQPLDFNKSTFAIRFKPTQQSSKIAEVYTSDDVYKIEIASIENVDENDCPDTIIVSNSRIKHICNIKNRAIGSDAINILSNSDVAQADLTVVWDNSLTWDNSYTWTNGRNTTESEYIILINSDGRVIVADVTFGIVYYDSNEYSETEATSETVTGASKITLYENTYYSDITLINKYEGDLSSLFAELNNGNWSWVAGTQILSHFNSNLNGADIDSSGNAALVGYKVYKSIGEGTKLYKIAETDDLDYKVIEDFVVGDSCKYKYYVYPVFKNVENEKLIYVNSPTATNDITLHYATNKVFSLKKIKDNTYCAALDNVWRLQLNLEDNGYTINNSKAFLEGMGKYTQESVGKLNYITKSISGLIGMIDCNYNKDEIIDTYDMLISWNDFASSADLKCLIDSRGLILPGNFEQNPSIEYMQGHGNPAVAKFNWRQKSDLNIISIYATLLPFNPIHGIVLGSNDDYVLTSDDNKILYAKKE